MRQCRAAETSSRTDKGDSCSRIWAYSAQGYIYPSMCNGGEFDCNIAGNGSEGGGSYGDDIRQDRCFADAQR